MTIKIICVGKTKQKFISDGIEEYCKRIQSYSRIELICLPDVKLTSATNVTIVKNKEAEIIRKYMDNADLNIALDEKGQQFSSLEFARYLEIKMNQGRNLSFFIGGVYGLDDELLHFMDHSISISKFTFTHQMVRLILLEQLYRAFTIIRGKKYHY